MQIDKSWPEYISQDLAYSREIRKHSRENRAKEREREKHAATQRAEGVCGALRESIRPSPGSAGFLCDARGDKE